MAIRVIEVFEDDFDGKPAAGTFVFGLGDDLFEIDLTKAHAEQLKAVLAPFIARARHIGKARPTVPAQRFRPDPGEARRKERDKAERDAARQWAREMGIRVADRGSVSQTVLDRYRDAMVAQSAATRAATRNLVAVPSATFAAATAAAS